MKTAEEWAVENGYGHLSRDSRAWKVITGNYKAIQLDAVKVAQEVIEEMEIRHTATMIHAQAVVDDCNRWRKAAQELALAQGVQLTLK